MVLAVSCGKIEDRNITVSESDDGSLSSQNTLQEKGPSSASEDNIAFEESNAAEPIGGDTVKTINIYVNDKSFTASLCDNATSDAFLELLPLMLDMNELNGNEKYFYLDTALPTDANRPNGINAGDIMLYGDKCVVLFYKSFSTSYSYTSIGRIDNPDDIADALGRGNVTVSFSLE